MYVCVCARVRVHTHLQLLKEWGRYLNWTLMTDLQDILLSDKENIYVVDVQSAQLCPTLWPHGLKHARPLCPSPSPEVGQVHVHCIGDAIQPSHPLAPSSRTFCLQSFPASGTFPVSQLFASDDQNTGASTSVLPTNIQGWFTLRLTGLISMLSKGLSGVFSSTTVQRHHFFCALPSIQSSFHNHVWLLGRPKPCLYGPLSA